MIKEIIENELYNVSDYNDEELYEILDLIRPSDRELEAKILFLIKKYETMQTVAGDKLVKFFEDIYSHFFDMSDNDAEEHDEIKLTHEGYENLNTEYANIKNANYTSNYNGNTIAKPNVEGNIAIAKTDSLNTNVAFTSNLEYTKGQLNPLLKQTTTRIISIDSQYREDKTSLTTDFAFDLSEPLKDVVSMKLYSFQIPYTWYTIGKSFGCNFFYFKGSSPGINNGNHDIEIKISPGNYSPVELTNAVSNAIKQSYTIYTDVSFATTDITYNQNTSLSTFTIDLKNQFNENGYYLNFPYFTTPYKFDASRNDSIPTFFGFQTGNYNTNSIKSLINLPLLPDSNSISTSALDNIPQFIIINGTNNYFTVIKYIGPDEYVPGQSVIDFQFDVKFSLPTPGRYSRNALIADLSNQIHNCIYLDNTYIVGSSIKRQNIDASNNIINGVNNPLSSYIELKIKPNRYTTTNNTNSKIAILFPSEYSTNNYNVWTGYTSCFRFDVSLNDVNNIYAEYPLLTEPQIFLLDNNVRIVLSCVHPGFDIPQNDIVIVVDGSLNRIDNYSYVPYPTLTDYVFAINQGIAAADVIYNGSLTTAALIEGGGGSRAYIDEAGYFNIYLDIEKTFDETTYVMDLTNTMFNTNNILITDENGNTLLTDLTKTYESFVNTGILFVTADTLIAVIYPKPGTYYGNQGDVTYTLKFGANKTYTDYTFLEEDVNNVFNDYVDPISGRTIFSGTKLTHIVSQTGYQIFLNIKIAKKLVAKNFSVNFIDSNEINDSWRSYLFIDTTMYNNFFNLETAFSSSTLPIKNDEGIDIALIDDSNEITIKGIAPIIYNYLTVERGINNIINFIAYEDGLFTTTGVNNLTIDVLKNTTNNTLAVTQNDLIGIINAQLNQSEYFKGTTLSTYYIGNNNYLKIRMNVNRIYTGKDYNLVFYDEISFVRCFVGATSVQNTTWDSTLGWILGYRAYTTYGLSDPALYNSPSELYTSANNIIKIIGDTGLCTNLYNYFLICLDDYNQNHLNDGLVTITGRDNSFPLPSYANKDNFTCDPVTSQLTYNTSNSENAPQLTQNQIYSLTTIQNNKYNSTAVGSSVSSASYGNGPYATNVFSILPMKVAGLANGASYMEFGGTLQNQGRNYFGPVNIRKMSVSLISDRGNKVDLNNANWSFSIICEQLNKLKPSG